MAATTAPTPPALAEAKEFATLQACLALRGHSLARLADGTFVSARWGMSKPLPDLQAVRSFLRLVEGTPR